MTKKFTVADLRAKAKEVLATVHIDDIRLKKLSCEGSDDIVPGPFDVSTDIAFQGRVREGQAVECLVRYVVVAQHLSNDVPTEAWRVRLELAATFVRDDEEVPLPQFSDEHLDAFAFALGVMHVHPYARETVQSMTSRLGYPPFTLDGVHPPTALPDDEVIELEAAD